MRKFLTIPFLIMFGLLLAACDSAEDRAEGHYQNALALLEEGDVDRAIVELRNVFQLVPIHPNARQELARVFLEEKNDPRQAYRQYLRVVEQFPEDLEARIVLSELSFYDANWGELERHGTVARELAPDNDRVQIIAAALDYRTTVTDDDEAARAQVVETAKSLSETTDQSRILSELLLDDHLRAQEMREALAILDELTESSPETQRYWSQRLQVLLALGDEEAVEVQLVELVERFPQDDTFKATLVRYWLSRDELDKTEAFLRELSDAEPEGEIGARVDLVRFLAELRSMDEARAEIRDAILNEENRTPFVLLGARMDFVTGKSDAAIADLETALAAAEPGPETDEMKVALAEMLLATGNEVGARSLVEAVLTDNPTQVGALKMRASWLIQADETDAAIAALRTALDSDPEDVATLNLMVAAYERTGSTDLARDFLSLAVEASGNAPAETIRYVQLLISEKRYLPAEDILLPAIRIAPNNLDLLGVAAQLYLEMEDLGRLQQVVDTLRRIGSDEALRMANEFEALRLNLDGGTDEALAYLESIAGGEDADVGSQILLLRARISTGDLEGAVALAEEMSAENPESPSTKLVLAKTLGLAGDLDRALAIYDELIQSFPTSASELSVEVATLQARNADPEGARETINAALTETPDDLRLLWASASFKEADGDIDGAIEIYENMYAADSSSLVVANNLASLLSTYRVDEESLERAWTIARRFRDAEFGAVKDTYGWIAHRRGNSQEALSYLEEAAAELSDDPVVQFHYAEVLLALDRKEEATAQYRKVLGLAGVGDTRPQIQLARDRIAEIEASAEAAE